MSFFNIFFSSTSSIQHSNKFQWQYLPVPVRFLLTHTSCDNTTQHSFKFTSMSSSLHLTRLALLFMSEDVESSISILDFCLVSFNAKFVHFLLISSYFWFTTVITSNHNSIQVLRLLFPHTSFCSSTLMTGFTLLFSGSHLPDKRPSALVVLANSRRYSNNFHWRLCSYYEH